MELVNSNENNDRDAKLFVNYDNTYVTGNEVIDTLYKYSESEMAILVATLPWIDACYEIETSGGTPSTVGVGIKGAYDNNGNSIPLAVVYRNQAAMLNSQHTTSLSQCYNVSNTQGYATPLRMINYRYILGSSDGNMKSVFGSASSYGGTSIFGAGLYMNTENRIVAECGFAQNSQDKEISNNTIVNINKPDRAEYIAPGGKFKSHLIVDNLGFVIGLAFIQDYCH